MKPRTLIAALAVVLLAGCAAWKKNPEAPPAPVAVSAAGLLAEVRARGEEVRRYDAVVEAELDGAPGGGRLFGGIQIEDAGAEGLALRLQAYTLTGLPVMELVARGPRFELFSPLEQRTYLNFTGAPGAAAADDFPLALFNETTLPVGLLLEQFGLFWGRGIGAAEMATTPEGYILYERAGGELVRETEWTRELRLVRVKLFSEGNLYGGMECAEYKGSGPASILPSRIELFQGELRLELRLSRVRTNQEVSGPPIGFRPPAAGRVIVLTPPLSPPPQPIMVPSAQPAPGTTVEPGGTVAPGGTAEPGAVSPASVDGGTASAPAPETAPAPPAEPSPGAPQPILPD